MFKVKSKASPKHEKVKKQNRIYDDLLNGSQLAKMEMYISGVSLPCHNFLFFVFFRIEAVGLKSSIILDIRIFCEYVKFETIS